MATVFWNGNVAHIEEHGLTVEDVFIIEVYEVIDEDTIYPVSAYEVDGG